MAEPEPVPERLTDEVLEGWANLDPSEWLPEGDPERYKVDTHMAVTFAEELLRLRRGALASPEAARALSVDGGPPAEPREGYGQLAGVTWRLEVDPAHADEVRDDLEADEWVPAILRPVPAGEAEPEERCPRCGSLNNAHCLHPFHDDDDIGPVPAASSDDPAAPTECPDHGRFLRTHCAGCNDVRFSRLPAESAATCDGSGEGLVLEGVTYERTGERRSVREGDVVEQGGRAYLVTNTNAWFAPHAILRPSRCAQCGTVGGGGVITRSMTNARLGWTRPCPSCGGTAPTEGGGT